jgi:3D (Asp-Asp-Asp) domain-containing protein
MRKHHFLKSFSLLLTAVILLASAACISSGTANALFLLRESDEPVVTAPPQEVVVPAEPVLNYFYEQITEEIPFETVRIPSPDLPYGEERVAQIGSDGKITRCYEVMDQDGIELDRILLTEEIEPPENEVIEYGTAVKTVDPDDRMIDVQRSEDGSGVLTFASGGTMKFSSIKDVTATAYTAGRGGAGFITASGTPARPGAVAVDRRVIPLGSKLYIVTNDGKYVYGIAVAEDTGVIGNRVDLYYDDYDACIQFGRRAATIYILED